MNKALLATAVFCSLSVLSTSSAAANFRGTVTETTIKNLVVSKISVNAEKNSVTATLNSAFCPIPVPPPLPPQPIVPEPVKPPMPTRDCGPGKEYVVELDSSNDADHAIYQLFLRAHGSWAGLNVSLTPSGQLLNVELGHRPIVY